MLRERAVEHVGRRRARRAGLGILDLEGGRTSGATTSPLGLARLPLTARSRGRDHACGRTGRRHPAPSTRSAGCEPILSRQAVLEIASAGISTRLTRPLGSPGSARTCPGRVTPTKWAMSHDLLRIAPGQDLGERVSAGDEVEVPVRTALGLQVAEGVHRVRRAAAVDVDPADREARVGRRGDDGHEIAVLGWRDRHARSSARADRWGRTRPRPARTGRRRRWPRPGVRGGSGRRCRPSRRVVGMPPSDGSRSASRNRGGRGRLRPRSPADGEPQSVA